jgi:thioredoxin 1
LKKVEKETERDAKRDGPIPVTDASFNCAVKKNRAILIDFWAEWCGPCKALAPTIEELAGKYSGKVFIGKIDIDKNPETAKSFGVRSIPTLVLLKDGKEVDRIIGSVPKRTIEKAAKKAFNLDSCEE